MTDLIEEVRKDITSAIEKDQLTLPTLPEVALKVRDIAEDDNASIMDLTNIIATDAALTARIIRVTNSPLLRAAQEVTNLNTAISRLGMNYTANLAIGLAMEQMFQATTDIIDVRLRDIWHHTAKIAGFCYVIAKKYTKIPAEEATLAALVHRLGVLPILTYAEESDLLLNDELLLDDVIEQLHGEIGGILLKKWDFPSTLIELPTSYQNINNANQVADCSDIIKVATLLESQDQYTSWSTIEWDKVPAFSALNIPSDASCDEVIELCNEVKNNHFLIN